MRNGEIGVVNDSGLAWWQGGVGNNILSWAVNEGVGDRVWGDKAWGQGVEDKVWGQCVGNNA